MAATDSQILDALRDTFLRVAQLDAQSASESLRSVGYRSLTELQDAIDRLEAKVQRAAGRRIFQPVRRSDV